MSNDGIVPTANNDDAKYAHIPADYPYAESIGAVSGAHPKLLLVEFQGKCYLPGHTPEERWNDWKYSESLIENLVAKCLESKKGKRSHMAEVDIIAQYYERAVAADGRYGTEAQLQWSFKRIADRLGWHLPDVCKKVERQPWKQGKK